VLTKTDYDEYGRVVRTRDGKGNWTQSLYNGMTAYTGVTHDLITKVTTVNPLGHTSVSNLDPRRGLPQSVVDANGKTTTLTYDSLGRLETVQAPGNTGTPPTMKFTYDVLPANSAGVKIPSRIKTTTLRDLAGGPQIDESWQFFDGWGRTIETQMRQIEATDSARVVSATGYDEMGLARYVMPEFANPNTGTAGFSEPVNPTITNVDRYTVTDYDALGRATQVQEKSNGTNLATTTLGYEGNRSWTVPPVGGRAETETDGWGRPLKVTQYQDTAGATFGHAASYTYTGAGALDTITAFVNGATRTWDYDYDLMGRRTRSVDPDVGTTLYTYDENNNPITVDDPVAPVVTTTYDVLNRPTSRQATGAAVDATWTYDTGPPTATNTIGRLVSSTSTTGLGTFTNRVDTYDLRGNPTKVTSLFPASFVAGSTMPAEMSTTYTYNEMGLPKTAAYTALPGLPASTVTTDYARYGNLRSITTPAVTVAQATYNKLNHTTNLVSKDPGTTGSALERIYGWDLTTGRLAQLKTTNNIATGTTGSVNHLTLDYTYDKIGNPLRIVGTTQANTTATPQTGAWCYTYDWSNRLDTARVDTPVTTAGATTCNTTTGTNAAVLAATGTQPYAVDYNYTRDALDTVTSLGTTAGSVKYNYPASGGGA
jgi:YD repeat-containing protein